MAGPASPSDIRARLKELGYLKNPLDRFVFGGGSTGGALRLALGAGARGALIAGPLLAGFGIVLLGDELAPDERPGWFLAFTVLFGLVVFLWVIAQALVIHFVARRRGRSIETLPVLVGIIAAAGLLLPALLWLLASGRIHSPTLGAGFSGALIAAVALLFAASVTIFAATRAAALHATGEPAFFGRSRGGMRSALLGLVFLGLIGGALWRGQRFRPPAAPPPATLQRDAARAKGGSLRIIAVDGVHAGELAPSLGSRAVKLTGYPADPDLLAVWKKFQTGLKEWRRQSFIGYRAVWGGRSHSQFTAPGRLLALLHPLGLSGVTPLPGSVERSQYFWEAAFPAPSYVVGGWQTHPVSPRSTSLISDRVFYALMLGRTPRALYRFSGMKPIDPAAVFAGLEPGPQGLQQDDFHRRMLLSALGGRDTGGARLPLYWVYLPGADVVCAQSAAQCESAKERNREFLSRLGDDPLLLIENPGRQGGAGAIWFRPAKDESIRPVHAPEELAAAVLDYLGYPLSAELAGVKPDEAKLVSYGRILVEDSTESDDLTIKALKSLGYLQ